MHAKYLHITLKHIILYAFSTFTSRAFSVWNSFNPGLRSINTLGSFKSKRKTTLFVAAYSGDNYCGTEPSSTSDSFSTWALYKYNMYTVSKKTTLMFLAISRKHCRIFIIFGRNITEKVSNQKMLYFTTSPN